MNSRNQPISNRRKWRRRRTARMVVLVIVSVLLLVFVGFVIAGNALLNKTQQSAPPPEEQNTEKDSPPTLAQAKKIRGYPILAETSDSSTFSSRLGALTAKGVTAVSVPLNTVENTLLYRSPVAETLGMQEVGAHTVTLERVAQYADEMGVYVSGTFYLTAFQEENDLLRSVLLAQASAVVAEAIRAGLDDLLLVVSELSEERIEELIRFVDGIRALEPNAILGLAIGEQVLEMKNANVVLTRLDEAVNYMALDLTRVGDTDVGSYVDAAIHDTQHHYALLYYHMRLLLPSGADDAQQAALIEAVEGDGFQDWQILTQP